jgi:hypothetical protein
MMQNNSLEPLFTRISPSKNLGLAYELSRPICLIHSDEKKIEKRIYFEDNIHISTKMCLLKLFLTWFYKLPRGSEIVLWMDGL